MAREKFSPAELTQVVGEYPGYLCGLKFFPDREGVPAEPKYHRPITPRENMKLFLEGKTPYWIPSNGKFAVDVQGFRPRLYPDNVCMHMIFDGSGSYTFDSLTKKGLFDLDWEFVPVANGATVLPGNPKVKDICNWEDYVTFPDLDSWDWEGCERDNKEFLNIDKFRQLGIPCGFWERLMAFCDVEEAAMALVDDDCQEAVHRLFDRLAQFHIDYIDHVVAHCQIDCVLMHDDWGHQRGQFFSLDTAREMVMPYLKRVIDHCHSLGLYFELHCCGLVENFVPMFVEMGVDLWCGQNINDFDMLLERHKNDPIAFGVGCPVIAPDTPEEEIRTLAKQWVDKYQNKRALQYFMGAPKSFTDAVYEFSRLAYEDAE